VNATGLFTEPGRRLRLVSDNDQLACFEFAATHGSESMRRRLHGVRAGMTELEAFSLFRPTGMPYSYHPVMLSGERAALGLASASGRVLRSGDPVSASLGYWGSNIARGGFLAEGERDLPEAASDYVERLVTPYFRLRRGLVRDDRHRGHRRRALRPGLPVAGRPVLRRAP
jgi:hypothetical protein